MNTKGFLCTAAIVAVCALSCNGKKDTKRAMAETATAEKEVATADKEEATAETEEPEEDPKRKTWAEEQGLTGDVLCVSDSIWYKAYNYDDDIPHMERHGMRFNFSEICKTVLNEYGQPKAITLGNEDYELWEEDLEWKDKYNTFSNIRRYNGGDWDTLSYFYDKDRLSTILQRYNFTYGFTDTISYKYDSQGRIAEIRFTEARVESKITRYTYIDENDSYKEVETFADGETTETTIYLDTDGRTIKKLSEDEEWNYQYNDKGLLAREAHTCGKAHEKVTTYEYIYDERGNWIEKTVWAKDGDNEAEIKVLTTRTIRYKED